LSIDNAGRGRGYLRQLDTASARVINVEHIGLRKRFDAKLEGNMLSQRVRNVMEQKRLLTAPAETSVAKAAKLMRRRKVGAIMVVEDQSLVGIFTERDALFGVIAGGRDPRTTTLAEVMTTAPQVVDPDKSFGYALLMMYQKGFRHLPVIENGKLIGIVSARNALDPSLEEFVAESHRREQFLREQN
jgi:CBS domain-containing protein